MEHELRKHSQYPWYKNMYFKNVQMKNKESIESLKKGLSCQFYLF